MACLFAGHLAGNCDAAGDTWPVIHSSTASVFSGDPSSLGLAITARRRSRAAIPIAGTAGARSDGSAAAAVLALAALMKDGTRQTTRYRRRDAQQKRAFDGRAVGRKADVIEQLPEAIAWAEAQGPGRHSVARRLRAARTKAGVCAATMSDRSRIRCPPKIGPLPRHAHTATPRLFRSMCCTASPLRPPKWGFPS
jgi:hypothetical protein